MESVLRHYLVSRWRRLIVIILTSGLGLLVIWPAADEYVGLMGRRSELSVQLEQVRKTVDRLNELQTRAQEERTEAAQWEARAITADRLHTFRGKVVELARSAGCQIRRANVSEANQRQWQPGDLVQGSDPNGKNQSPYQVRTRSMSVVVLGGLNGVRQFLGRLSELDSLVLVEHFSLLPSGADGKEVVLELDMLLYDLIEATKLVKSPTAT